jgi:SNF2 family DNA or RNA helicase
MAPDTCQNRVGLDWPAPLLRYQETGVAWLLAQQSALLADEMGLGKTDQAIAALRLLACRGEVRRALVVCPAGLILQWRRHLRQWAPELGLATVMGAAEERVAAWARDATVYLTGYESLRSDWALRTLDAPFARL